MTEQLGFSSVSVSAAPIYREEPLSARFEWRWIAPRYQFFARTDYPKMSTAASDLADAPSSLADFYYFLRNADDSGGFDNFDVKSDQFAKASPVWL